MEPGLLITWKGGAADNHRVDLRGYKESLAGIEQILRHGIVMSTEHKLPTGREKMRFSVQASPLREGSAEILLWIVPIVELAVRTSPSLLQEVARDWLSAVLLYRGGEEERAHGCLQSVQDFMEDSPQGRVGDHRELALDTIYGLGNAAKQATMLPKREGYEMLIGDTQGARPTVIDKPIAERIAANENTVLGPEEEITTRLTGFSYEKGKVELAVEGRPIQAKVLDSTFKSRPNIYATTARDAGEMGLRVRIARDSRTDKIKRVYVMQPAGRDGGDLLR